MKFTDVTLREGDQMPGRSYSVEQKVAAGKALDRLGISYLQAGYPITGENDTEAISELTDTVDADVVGLARAREGDVEAVLESQADVVEIFLSISESHLKHVLGVTRERAIEMLKEAVARARAGDTRVHLSLVDAFRTDPAEIEALFSAFPDVEMITAADTVGARIPSEVRDIVESLQGSIDMDRFGVHFHDDLGVGTANALAAYEAGAGKVDVSVASLGERAGNSSLEELVVAAVTGHHETFGLNVEELAPVCWEVLEELDEPVQPRKAILGREVTEHESGIHTTAMLEEPSTFEPFDPTAFGGKRRLVFGEGTGRTGARKLLEIAGIEIDDGRVTEFSGLLDQEGPIEKDKAIDLARSYFST